MAAAHHLEIDEDVNLNMDRETKEELEEEEGREGGADKGPFKPRKVHRIVSKWMLPEPVRRTYLERANCLPPPVFIISISIAEVNMRAAVHRCEDSWGLRCTGALGQLQREDGTCRELGGARAAHTGPDLVLRGPPGCFLPSQALSVKC